MIEAAKISQQTRFIKKLLFRKQYYRRPNVILTPPSIQLLFVDQLNTSSSTFKPLATGLALVYVRKSYCMYLYDSKADRL